MLETNGLEEVLTDEEVTILLVCQSQEIATEIQTVLKESLANEDIIGRVENVRNLNEQLTRTNGKLFADFVVFIVESFNTHCLEMVASDLNLIRTPYPRHRMCAVCLDVNYSTPLKPATAWDFAKFHQINVLMGSVKDENRTAHLCGRIGRLLKTGCGVNGFPIPTRVKIHEK